MVARQEQLPPVPPLPESRPASLARSKRSPKSCTPSSPEALREPARRKSPSQSRRSSFLASPGPESARHQLWAPKLSAALRSARPSRIRIDKTNLPVSRRERSAGQNRCPHHANGRRLFSYVDGLRVCRFLVTGAALPALPLHIHEHLGFAPFMVGIVPARSSQRHCSRACGPVRFQIATAEAGGQLTMKALLSKSNLLDVAAWIQISSQGSMSALASGDSSVQEIA